MLVRKLRLQRGWSQEHLAELVGVTPRTIQRIERGYKPGLEEDLPMSTNDQTLATPTLAADEEAAIQYVKGIKEFYSHLAFYIVFVLAYAAIWGFVAFTNPMPNREFAFSFLFLGALGWGVGLVVHGLIAFETIGRRWPGVDWEKKAIEKRLGRKL